MERIRRKYVNQKNLRGEIDSRLTSKELVRASALQLSVAED
jgi:hypothetical protein